MDELNKAIDSCGKFRNLLSEEMAPQEESVFTYEGEHLVWTASGIRYAIPQGMDFTIRLLRSIIGVIGPPLNREGIQVIVRTLAVGLPSIVVDVDEKGLKPKVGGLAGSLNSALPYLQEGTIIKCEECSKFVAKRGDHHRFCSNSCKSKSNGRKKKRPYDPNKKEYNRLKQAKHRKRLKIKNKKVLAALL